MTCKLAWTLLAMCAGINLSACSRAQPAGLSTDRVLNPPIEPTYHYQPPLRRSLPPTPPPSGGNYLRKPFMYADLVDRPAD